MCSVGTGVGRGEWRVCVGLFACSPVCARCSPRLVFIEVVQKKKKDKVARGGWGVCSGKGEKQDKNKKTRKNNL